jgi:predicted phage tail protein
MLIRLHGIFAQDYGPEHEIEADTIADAITGLTRQLGFYDDRPIELRPVARIAGVDNPLQLLEKTEQKVIHMVPAMIGGGGFGRIIAGAVLIAFALTNPFGWAAMGAFGTTWGAMAFTMGATLVLSGVMQLFMKAPKIDKSSDPEQSKYFGLGDNTVEIGTPIAYQYGRGPATGHVLAVNVDAKDIVVGVFPTSTT